ncbi:MAG: putative short chain dehydrogenase, partial [Streblomastix strix]
MLPQIKHMNAEKSTSPEITENEIEIALRVFRTLEKDPIRLKQEKYKNLCKSAGHVIKSPHNEKFTKESKKERKKRQKAEIEKRRNLDEAILRSRGLMQQRREVAQQKGLKLLESPTGNEITLSRDQSQQNVPLVALPPPIEISDIPSSQQVSTNRFNMCYTCGGYYKQIHFFYSSLCPSCASLNWQKRLQVADLRGKIVICTGSRVKIGYQCCLRLLKCGAFVIATTRFPNDCALRYIRDPDFLSFQFRLHIYGLDFRDLNSVQRFTDFICQKYPRLDIIINNAAQTVRRPPQYYQHLMENELKGIREMPLEAQWLRMNDPLYENEIQGNHNLDEQQQYSNSPSSLPELRLPKHAVLFQNASKNQYQKYIQDSSGPFGGSIQISQDGTCIISNRGRKDKEKGEIEDNNQQQEIEKVNKKKQRSISPNPFGDIQAVNYKEEFIDEDEEAKKLITKKAKRTKVDIDNEIYDILQERRKSRSQSQSSENGISSSSTISEQESTTSSYYDYDDEYYDYDDDEEESLNERRLNSNKGKKNKNKENEEDNQRIIFGVNIPMERKDQRIILVSDLPEDQVDDQEEDDEESSPASADSAILQQVQLLASDVNNGIEEFP